MAQTKNTFIKSRMNKDLDERLVPNGEYRDGFNIEVSQSEDADVGTVSTALGNVKLTDFGLTADCDARIIGYFADEKDKDIYIFITNFVDTSNNKLSLFPSEDAICQIWKRNIETNLNTKLVEGEFLNLSLTHEVLNINLLEDLLFWTDNRNQPRKINVTKANPGNEANPTYYTNEDQISVAKYYPFAPIELLDDYIVNYSVTNGGGGTVGSPAPYYGFLNLPNGPGDIVPTTAVSPSVGTGLTVQITSAVSDTAGGGTDGNLLAVKIIEQGVNYKNGDVVRVAPASYASPINAAQLTLVVETQSTMKDKCTEFLPETFVPTSAPASITSGISFDISGSGNEPGEKFVGAIAKIEDANGIQISGTEGARVVAAVYSSTPSPILNLGIEWKNSPQTVTGVSKITLGVNPDYDANWPGDCDFLKDKFVRFAYRFKFDDNEYSLISPFTQACFIPKQNGYFLSETRGSETITDSELAYKSTDLEFFENSVNNIGLKIPSPQYLESVDNFFSNALEKMHIEEIDIIYKDDEENALKVIDTITRESFENLNSNYIIYDYQSRKPIRTLPSSEITRVSDTVPLRSLTQEVAGNRIIYGNYTDGHTSNETLNYEIAAAAKSVLPEILDAGIIDQGIRKEYQNHTLKQNRTYQVGIVLSDRYGRQSDVILSSLDNSKTIISGESYRGSTIFRPFYSAGPNLLNIPSLPALPTTWPGDSLKVQFNSQVPENTGQFGYPGLFKDYNPPSISNLYSGNSYATPTIPNAVVTNITGTGTGMTVNYTVDTLNGTVTSVTITNFGTGYINGDILSIPGGGPDNGTASFVFNAALFANLTGWYSYKIVVKQQEHDYYNVYLPGVVNGAINEDGLISNTRATLSLYGDNINKVPKDLLDVGPSQTNYRSDTRLSLRVENTSTDSKRFYPGSNVENVVSLSELTDLGIDLTRVSEVVDTGGIPPAVITLGPYNNKIQRGMSVTAVSSANAPLINSSQGAYVSSYYSNPGSSFSSLKISGTTTTIPTDAVITFGPPGVIFNSGNNPIIGILSTSKSIGVAEQNNFAALLAVAETQPVKSLLDIFYETTSAGLIESLNTAVVTGTSDTNIPISIEGVNFTLSESQTGTVTCTNTFQATNVVNALITNANAVGSLVKVVDGTNAPRNNDFKIVNSNGFFTIQTNKQPGEGFYVSDDARKTTFDFTVKITINSIDVFTSFSGSIKNITPSYVTPLPVFPFPALLDTLNILRGFKALNGSGDTSLNKNDLTWEIVSWKALDTSENRPLDRFIAYNQLPGGNIVDQTQWPTILRVDGDNLGPIEDYQIVVGQNYGPTGRFGGLQAGGSATITALSQVVSNDEVDVVIYDINSTAISPTLLYDPDGPQQNNINNLWGLLSGGDGSQSPYNISINISTAVKFIDWEIKIKVKDGGNLNALEQTILIRQE